MVFNLCWHHSCVFAGMFPSSSTSLAEDPANSFT